MTAWMILAALLIALTLSSLLVSLYALYRTQRISRAADAQVHKACEECAQAIEAMRKNFESLAHMQNTPRVLNAEPLPSAPKSSMNLSRRSQALRLRRKGEPPEKIAAALDMPRQEVDLLLKVHEIVLNNL